METKEEVERWEWLVSVTDPDQPLMFDSDCLCHEQLKVAAVSCFVEAMSFFEITLD